MILSTILLQLHELLLQEPEHLQPGLVLLLLQHRGRHHGHETLQVDSHADWDGVSNLPAIHKSVVEKHHVCKSTSAE